MFAWTGMEFVKSGKQKLSLKNEMPKPDPILTRRSTFRFAHPAQSEIQAQGPPLTNIDRDVKGSLTLQITCATHQFGIYPLSEDLIEVNPWSSDNEFAIDAST